MVTSLYSIPRKRLSSSSLILCSKRIQTRLFKQLLGLIGTDKHKSPPRSKLRKSMKIAARVKLMNRPERSSRSSMCTRLISSVLRACQLSEESI